MSEEKQFSWFKAMRNPEAIELYARSPHAFFLAYLIAFRGQYSDTFNRFNLQPGEALLGDYEKCGMSEQNYRTAKRQLIKWRFATFKVTPHGTIGTLVDSRLFTIFRVEANTQDNSGVTDRSRTANTRLTTTYKTKERKEAKNEKSISEKFPVSQIIDPKA